jgi:hypothetical protein
MKQRAITPLAERFWPKVQKTETCWLWMAGTDRKGYGVIGQGRRPARMLQAHRVAYELCVGAIPEGLVLDHLCRNPPCVNPSHLEPVTNRENILRGETFARDNSLKTHCPKKNGSRHCVACHRQGYHDRKNRSVAHNQ